MKKYIILAVIVLVGAAVWYQWHSRGVAAVDEGPKTAQASRGNIELAIDAIGSVESNLDIEIKSKASGAVMVLPYDVSARVPRHVPGKNDDQALLARLDPVDEKHLVEQAQAALAADQARVAQAKSNLALATDTLRTTTLEAKAGVEAAQAKADMAELTLKRQKELFARQACSQDELDNVMTAARVAAADLQTAISKREALKGLELTIELRKADVALAEANLQNSTVVMADAQQRLNDTSIYCPIDGVLTSRTIQIGQIAASAISNVGGGTTLMTVSDLSHVFVMAAVDESDIGHLYETGKLDQEVTITADAYPGKRFTGKVVQITPRGINDSNIVTYPVKIEVLGEGKDLLLPKMTANVHILANRHENTLLVPNPAIRYEKDQPYVELVTAGQPAPQRRPVKLGLSDGLSVEVLEGLNAGDVVMTTSPETRWSNSKPKTTIVMNRDGKPDIK